MAKEMSTINTMLNTASTTNRAFSNAGTYGCLQNTYAMSNLVGFKSTTPGGSGAVYGTWPAYVYCYLTAYGDGSITITNGSTVTWFYLFGSGFNGNAYEVYCYTGGGWGSIYGDTRDAWITLGTYKQWYIGGQNSHSRQLLLYFRNTYWPQTNPGTFDLYTDATP
jgi:hypothetical protein